MNGVIYCRVSSKEQIEGTSLASQESACREYARSRDIGVVRVFIEQGESAKFADRTQLLALVDFCRANKGTVNVVLVWKLDRFARNVGDHFSVKATLKKYGVEVVSVTEPIDDNPEGKLLETILAGFAQFDNDIRAMRTVQGMQRKIQEGIFPWRPPLGYRGAVTGSEKKTQADEPDQPLFGLLQKAWKAFATGAYTKADMRRLMKHWGVSTKRGKSLTDQSIDNLFRNPFYAGVLLDPWSRQEYAGKHVPMVSKEDFARVQQIVHNRNHKVPHTKERPEFPLRGLVRCPKCEGYLTAGYSRGRSARYPYYACHHAVCTDRPNYRLNAVHEEFRDHLARIAPKSQLIWKVGEMAIAEAERRKSSNGEGIARKKVQVERVEQQARELIAMRTERLITDEEFKMHKAKLDEQRFALESVTPERPINLGVIRNDLEKIVQPLSNLPKTWEELRSPYQSRFNRMILPAGFAYGTIRTAELGLLFSTLDAFGNRKSNVVPLAGESLNRFLQEVSAFSELLGMATAKDDEIGGLTFAA